jgi:hypothetical protein
MILTGCIFWIVQLFNMLHDRWSGSRARVHGLGRHYCRCAVAISCVRRFARAPLLGEAPEATAAIRLTSTGADAQQPQLLRRSGHWARLTAGVRLP